MRTWCFIVAMAVGLTATSCSTKPPMICPPLPAVNVNQHDAVLALDTGSPFSWFYPKSARRAGLESSLVLSNMPINGGPVRKAFLSRPVPVATGTNAFEAQFVVCDPGWLLRLGLELDGVDGLVGWPEVRDNVLVFDPDRRTITGTNKVPAEATNWTRFGIGESEQLSLTTVRPDGRIKVICVDTGSPGGVSLPEAEWQKWQAAHPKARVERSHAIFPGIGLQSTRVAWADELVVGGLRLTDVPVDEVPAALADFTNQYSAGLGRYALSRMDLVVDGRNNVAYANPRSPPGAPFSGAPRSSRPAKARPGNEGWAATNGVELSHRELLMSAAQVKALAEDFDGAVADCTLALKLDASDVSALTLLCGMEVERSDYGSALADLDRLGELGLTNSQMQVLRGQLHLNQGDPTKALADIQRVLEHEPGNRDARLAHAEARQLADDFAGAAADFDALAPLEPGNSNYFRVAAALLRLRAGALPSEFAPSLASWRSPWFEMLGRYVAGGMSEDKLLAFARQPHERPVAGQECAAFYIIGEMRLVRGDAPGARPWFEKCLGTKQKHYIEYQFAKGELAKLGAATR